MQKITGSDFRISTPLIISIITITAAATHLFIIIATFLFWFSVGLLSILQL